MLSEDTFRGNIGDPLSLNLYTFCSNNPIRYTDPSGHWQESDANLPAWAQELLHQYTTDWDNATEANDPDLASQAHDNAEAIRRRCAAVAYASQCHNQRNNDYYSYSTDCANFVSQCLQAGGFAMNDAWHSYKGSFNSNKFFWDPIAFSRGLFNDQYWYNWDVGEPWRLAGAQYDYFSNPENGYINGDVITISNAADVSAAASYANILPGDIMYFAGDNGVHHAVMVTKVENGEIYYAGHTNNAFDKPLSANLGNNMVLVVKMNY